MAFPSSFSPISFSLSLFPIGLSKKEFESFYKSQFFLNIVLENVPQLCVQISFLAYTGEVTPIVISALLSSLLGTLNTVMTLVLKSKHDSFDVHVHIEVVGSCTGDEKKIGKRRNLTGVLERKLSRWLKVSRSLVEVPFVTALNRGCIIHLVLDSDNKSFVPPSLSFFSIPLYPSQSDSNRTRRCESILKHL